MNRKRKSQFLRALERRREEAWREQPEETTEAEAPPSRVLVERAPLMFPKPKRRAPWK